MALLLPAAELKLAERVEQVDLLAREPMAVELANGAIFVSGYGAAPPRLWKSTDQGAHWARVNAGTAKDGAAGNSDVDLAAARDGALYFANMTFDEKTNEGAQIAVGVSRDAGEHWKWTTVSKHRFDDRPWVAVAPDGTAHLIWNDGGVWHSTSRDRGDTWSAPVRIVAKGGSSHLAVGPRGEIAVRVSPASASGNKFDAGIDRIALSTDGGKTWKTRNAPGKREWSANLEAFPPRWVEPLAWDAAGRLYSFWTNLEGLWLARSANRGRSWKIWKLAASAQPAYFPYLVARGKGELACTWFSGPLATFQAHAGFIHDRGGNIAPSFIQSAPFQPDTWDWEHERDRDTAGEYLGITFLESGGFAVVSAIQNKKEKRYGFTWMRFEVPSGVH